MSKLRTAVWIVIVAIIVINVLAFIVFPIVAACGVKIPCNNPTVIPLPYPAPSATPDPYPAPQDTAHNSFEYLPYVTSP